MVNTTVYNPDTVSPPGETLEELLEERGISQADLADRMGRPRKTINEIVQGKAAITPETALQFEYVLGTPARFWLVREQQYREYLARQQNDYQLEGQTDFLQTIPLRQLIDAGWIEKKADEVAQLRTVLSFYGISTPAQYEKVQACYRLARRYTSDEHLLTAWLRRGEMIVQTRSCDPYNEQRFKTVLAEARALTLKPFAVAREELPRLCATAGVAVVVVPELPGIHISGAVRWLNSTKALLQLSLRYKTNDQFWFSFFHEAAHVLLHSKRSIFVDEADQAHDKQEEEANRFAADTLISPKAFADLRKRKGSQHWSATLIQRFATDIGIAPGIVVGRLQYEQLLPRTHLNNLKEKLVG